MQSTAAYFLAHEQSEANNAGVYDNQFFLGFFSGKHSLCSL